MKFVKTDEKLNNKGIQRFTLTHFIEFSSNFNHVFFGTDQQGNLEDLELVEEFACCNSVECIRYYENLIDFVNVEFMKHVSLSFNIFNIGIDEGVFLDKNDQQLFDLKTWIKKIKRFYILILANKYLFEKLIKAGYSLSQIENVIEIVSEIESFILSNNKKQQE